MKTISLSLVFMYLLSVNVVMAQVEKEVTIYVAGNCDLAKIQIENAAKSIDGVINANWSKDRGILKLSVDTSRVDIKKVHRTIVRAGYDTRMYRARARAYYKLPDSCKYERIPEDKMIGKKKLFRIAQVPALGIQF